MGKIGTFEPQYCVMKKLIYLIVLSLAFLGCSSDDEATPVVPTPTPAAPEDVFFTKLTYDGVPVLDGVHYPSWNPLRYVGRNGNQFSLEIYAELGYKRIIITFNKLGDIVSVASYNHHGIDGILSHFNYRFMARDHFHFELESLDEAAGTVRGNFSGRLYLDKEDLNSDFIELSGSFYNQIGGNGTGDYRYTYAKFNGVDWHNTHQPSFSDIYYADYALLPDGIYASQSTGDDAYRIIIAHPTSIGISNFTDNTSGVYVRLGKYNMATGLYEDYTTTAGSLVIAEKNLLGFGTAEYKGVFNFTAVNPNNPADVIQVTEGHFYFRGHS